MKRFMLLIPAAALAFTLGCNMQTGMEPKNNGQTETFPSGSPAGGIQASAAAQPEVTPLESLDESDMFSNRDSRTEYEDAQTIVLADGASSSSDESVEIDGDTVTVTQPGSYVVSGALSCGMLVVEAEKDDKIQLVFNGVAISNSSSAALYIKQADKVFVTLAEGSDNSLSTSDIFIAVDDNNIDAALFSKDDLTINGSGNLSITCAYGHGIAGKDDLVFTGGNLSITSAAHGISGKDSIRIKNGSFIVKSVKDAFHSENKDDEDSGFIYIEDGKFDITAELDGISAQSSLRINGGSFTIKTGGGSANASFNSQGFNERWPASGSNTNNDGTSAKALKSVGELVIRDGEFTIDSSDDALHSNGNLIVEGGTLSISSGDDGAHADCTVVINGGSITVTKCYEGIEGQGITINGGELDITSADDGLNAAGGADSSGRDRPGAGMFDVDTACSIVITAGKLHLSVEGDGIDSNGSLLVSGGEIIVIGPTNDGNSSLDAAGTAEINGGLFVAAGSAGMAEGFDGGSEQASICYCFSERQSSGGVTLLAEDGTVLVELTSDKAYSCLLISCEGLKLNGKYSIVTEAGSYGITLDSMNWSNASFGGGRRDKPGGFWGN